MALAFTLPLPRVEAQESAAPTPQVEVLYDNCVKFVHTIDPRVPFQDATQFTPNTTPHEGAVALFKYRSGASHVALVTKIEEEFFEVTDANYVPGKITVRKVPWDNYALRGFYSPGNNPSGP